MGPDHVPHLRYIVTFTAVDGSVTLARVITNRGTAKAVHLATLGRFRLMRRRGTLDVSVRCDGSPELYANGAPILEGFAFDRDEW